MLIQFMIKWIKSKEQRLTPMIPVTRMAEIRRSTASPGKVSEAPSMSQEWWHKCL
jgi:hypothetical protein